jgi:alpha,alpha-trehalose phosphorylase
MFLHQPLPVAKYGTDPMALEVLGLDPTEVGLQESLFSLSNGFVGVRGSWDQGWPLHQPGTLINGFHETWEIEYPEKGYGYATVGQTIVYVPEGTVIEVAVDGRVLELTEASLARRLDLAAGILSTTAQWEEVTVTWQRLVSLVEREVVALRLEVEAHRDLDLRVRSLWRNRQDTDYLGAADAHFDPRRARSFGHSVLDASGPDPTADGLTATASYRTRASGLELHCRIIHRPDVAVPPVQEGEFTVFSIRLAAGEGFGLDKIVEYRTGPSPSWNGNPPTYAGAASRQHGHLQDFWNHARIHVEAEQNLQQALNWTVFQLHQASALVAGTGVPAKGLTGQAYEGHYFWDMDVFLLPFLVYQHPGVARRLIEYRYATLPAARERAGQLDLPGALFPWRTINGQEASAYYEAGTAQYHIDAAVIHAVARYVEATGDEELLWEMGVEMAVETARMWRELGFFAGDSFHIHTVTGPDEYSALVDDNAYTNYMARMNLRVAATWARQMAVEEPEAYAELAARLELSPDEIGSWERAAAAMHIPFDPNRRITPQDARFLAKEPWDWSTPKERYPLLLHYHPLVIYRYQVLKQADVVMAMLMLPDEFPLELARANFDFYERLTTGDSSLSAPVEAAVCAAIGYPDRGLDYLLRALWVDLADLGGNAADGVHLASAGGTWLAVVSGFGGFRMRGGLAVVDPRMPGDWHRLRYSVLVRGTRLWVDATQKEVMVWTEGGAGLEAEVAGKPITVGSVPQTIEVRG